MGTQIGVTVKNKIAAGDAFYLCQELAKVQFQGTPQALSSNCFISCSALTTINVPWGEGEVANAPWGATNATINYNYTGE